MNQQRFLFRAGKEGFEPSVRFYPDNRLAGDPNQPLWHLPIPTESKAEGEGFEPTVKLSPHTCFQDRRLKPLGHPSKHPVEADRF